jgi:hypothetical protein
MVVVDVGSRPLLADLAKPTSGLDEGIHLESGESISRFEVIAPSATVQAILRRFASRVVAGLAIAAATFRCIL